MYLPQLVISSVHVEFLHLPMAQLLPLLLYIAARYESINECRAKDKARLCFPSLTANPSMPTEAEPVKIVKEEDQAQKSRDCRLPIPRLMAAVAWSAIASRNQSRRALTYRRSCSSNFLTSSDNSRARAGFETSAVIQGTI